MSPFIYIYLVGVGGQVTGIVLVLALVSGLSVSKQQNLMMCMSYYLPIDFQYTDLVCSVDISSEDDTRSIKSARSVKRYLIEILACVALLTTSLVQCQ
jgi:hypothetical protein